MVFLMSHGADARAANHVGETPLELGSRLTGGFPKSRSLLTSILDSSKYQISGGAIFIVPGKPEPLTTLKEHKEDGNYDDNDVSTPRKPAASTTVRGVTFSPSRRNRRAQKREEIVDSRRPYAPSPAQKAAPSSGKDGGRVRNVPTLPRGDHETALGGARHRLAAGLACHNPRNQEGHRLRDLPLPRCSVNSPPHRRRSAHASHAGSAAEETRGQGVGVTFTDFRMGRSSAVLVGGGRRRRGRARAGPAPRPASCRADVDGGRSRRSAGSVMSRPATANRRTENNRSDGNAAGGSRTSTVGEERRGRGREETRLRKRRTEMARPEKGRGPSVPDSEARRQIAEWLRETAGTAPAVPPAAGHGSGEYLSETSSYVAVSHRSAVYKALQSIKGDGRGELISADKLRTSLCRVGQPLSPEEMDDLLQEADPERTGCVRRLMMIGEWFWSLVLLRALVVANIGDVWCLSQANCLCRNKQSTGACFIHIAIRTFCNLISSQFCLQKCFVCQICLMRKAFKDHGGRTVEATRKR